MWTFGGQLVAIRWSLYAQKLAILRLHVVSTSGHLITTNFDHSKPCTVVHERLPCTLRAELRPPGPHAKFVGGPFNHPFRTFPFSNPVPPLLFLIMHSVITHNRLNLIILSFRSELVV